LEAFPFHRFLFGAREYRPAPYHHARPTQHLLQWPEGSITDLRDGAAHAAVVAGWTPVQGGDAGD